MTKYRILHVDDDENNLLIFEIKFRGKFDVVSCQSPVQALELIEKEKFDAVISDYEMPGLNGLELFKKIMQIKSDMPIVFYTGQGNEEVAREAFLAGVADYLTKSSFEIAHWQKLEKSIINVIEKQGAIKKATEFGRKLETLIRNIPGMVYRCVNDREWTMEFVSENSVDLCGYESFEIINNHKISYNDIIHPDDRSAIWEEVQNRVSINQPFSLNYRIVCKDGTIKNVVEYGRLVSGEDGQQLALEGVILDDDGRKRAEIRSHNLNRLLRAIVDVNQLISNVDSKDELLQNACRILLYAGSYSLVWAGLIDGNNCLKPVAKSGIDEVYPDLDILAGVNECGDNTPVCKCLKKKESILNSDLSQLQQDYLWAAEALNKGHKSCVAIPLVTRNDVAGAIFVYSSIVDGFDKEEIELLNELAGEVTIALQAMEEAESRSKAELALKESEIRTKSLFEKSSDAIFVADRETRKIVAANRQAEILIGMPKPKIIGMYHTELYPVGLKEKMEAHFMDYLNGKMLTDLEGEILTISGAKIPVFISVSEFQFNDKKLIQAIFKDYNKCKEYQHKVEITLSAPSFSFAEMAKMLPDIVFEMNLSDYRLTYLNSAGFTVSGYTPEDLEKGIYIFNLISSDDMDRVKIENMKQGVVEHLGVFAVKSKNGCVTELDIRALAFFEDGKPVSIRGITREPGVLY